MSALDSDPWFPRGTTLGVTSTSDGTHIVGTQRWFTDTRPDGTVNSNVQLKCIAVRNTSAGALTPGQVVKGKTTALLSEVDGNGDVDSPIIGVVDEYLPAAGVAVNDIFWLVVNGPTTADSSGTVNQGAFVSVGTSGTAGKIVASVANKTVGVALAAAASNKVRVLVGLGGFSARVSTP
jgi:hypothetical protein